MPSRRTTTPAAARFARSLDPERVRQYAVRQRTEKPPRLQLKTVWKRGEGQTRLKPKRQLVRENGATPTSDRARDPTAARVVRSMIGWMRASSPLNLSVCSPRLITQQP